VVEQYNTVRLGYVKEGDFVGHVALMNRGRHTASVQASQTCMAYVLDKSDFKRVLNDHPSVALVLQMSLGNAICDQHFQNKKVHGKFSKKQFVDDIHKTHQAIAMERSALVKEEKSPSRIPFTSLLSPQMKGKNYFSYSPSAANLTTQKESVQSFNNKKTSGNHTKPSKWSIIRKTVQDARVTAMVAGMVKSVNRTNKTDQNKSESYASNSQINTTANAREKTKAVGSSGSPKNNPSIKDDANSCKTSFSSRQPINESNTPRTRVENSSLSHSSMFVQAYRARVGLRLEDLLEQIVDYDSDEEPSLPRKLSKHTALHRSNPDFTEFMEQKVQTSSNLYRRRSSFPSYEHADWVDSTRHQHIM